VGRQWRVRFAGCLLPLLRIQGKAVAARRITSDGEASMKPMPDGCSESVTPTEPCACCESMGEPTSFTVSISDGGLDDCAFHITPEEAREIYAGTLPKRLLALLDNGGWLC
jgi:hypothetical protein